VFSASSYSTAGAKAVAKHGGKSAGSVTSRMMKGDNYIAENAAYIAGRSITGLQIPAQRAVMSSGDMPKDTYYQQADQEERRGRIRENGGNTGRYQSSGVANDRESRNAQNGNLPNAGSSNTQGDSREHRSVGPILTNGIKVAVNG